MQFFEVSRFYSVVLREEKRNNLLKTMNKKGLEVLTHFFKPVENEMKNIWLDSSAYFKESTDDLECILRCVKKKTISFKKECVNKRDEDVNKKDEKENKDNNEEVFVRPSISKKKRGRQKKSKLQDADSNPDSDSLNSSVQSNSSTSSNRSRRAAAQAADQKLAQVQSMLKATKLRRPTDFNEKQHTVVSSPPTKSRRTHQNQTAVHEVKEAVDECIDQDCQVLMERLTTPQIKKLTRSRSLGNVSQKRKSSDLFEDSEPLSVMVGTGGQSNDEGSSIEKKKKLRHKGKNLDHTQVGQEIIPVAQSSPCEFNGFDVSVEGDDMAVNVTYNKNATFVKKGRPNDIDENDTNKTKTIDKGIEESSNLRSRTKVLRKAKSQAPKIDVLSDTEADVVKIETEENCETEHESPEDKIRSKTKVVRKAKSQAHTIDEVPMTGTDGGNIETDEKDTAERESPDDKIRSRTKVVKNAKSQAHTDVVPVTGTDGGNIETDEKDAAERESPEVNIRSRTKVIKKAKPQAPTLDEVPVTGIEGGTIEADEKDAAERESPEGNIRSRTKVLKEAKPQAHKLDEVPVMGTDGGNIETDEKDEAERESPEGNIRSRTKVIKKAVQPESENVQPASGGTALLLSPATVKGEMVKKRVEDFEKMRSPLQEIGDQSTGARVLTRNAARNQTNVPKTIKTRNIPPGKLAASANKMVLSVERLHEVPKGRNTPVENSALKKQIVNKTVVESSTAVVRQTPNEDEKKKKEERTRRHEKEEEAKKKKEMTLKATSEEARRKREERLKKAATLREAAESEKALQAAKAEKEKEEKLQQLAAEKEKQKEEQLRKKLLAQQKALEHEERRRQDEEARLAKLREQEEEHKRILAVKEREQEMQKQKHLRLAEGDKNKHQDPKLQKIAVVNNAKLILQQGSPMPKTNKTPPLTSYVITPAREDRPPAPPKTENDYGIDDAHSEDSSDDEDQPKKQIPNWAQPPNRRRMLEVCSHVPQEVWDKFMLDTPAPDIDKIFPNVPMKKRARTSSAVWNTPPKYLFTQK